MSNTTDYHYTFSKKLELLLSQIAFFSPAYLPLRYHLYQSGFFNRARVSIPTISIGNLALGGVGKTPFVIWLLERLQGFKIAVLHSGYGGGDEGRMLQAKFPEAFIWANKKRHLGLQEAYAWGADLIILDDAFQCHRLHRDLDLVMIDASWSSRFSRESPKALKRADLIIANHVYNSEQARQVDQELRAYSQAPILHMKPVLEKLSRETSAVFCGIGNPKHFLALLAEQQIPIATCLLALDHEMPSAKTWANFMKSCEFHQVSRLLCTEKDFHRIQTSPLADSISPFEKGGLRGIFPVKMHLEVF